VQTKWDEAKWEDTVPIVTNYARISYGNFVLASVLVSVRSKTM